MNVHARSVVAEYWFWHEGCDHFHIVRHVLDHVLVCEHVVCHLRERIIFHIDLALSCRSYFMMMCVADYTKVVVKTSRNLTSVFLERVLWRRWIITFLEPAR